MYFYNVIYLKYHLKFGEVKALVLIVLMLVLNSCGIFRKSEKKELPVSQSKQTQKEKNIQKAISEARKYMGTPYKTGGNDKNGIDCSGLVKVAYDHTPTILPRTTKEQYQFGKIIKLEDAEKGDLIFFNTSKKKNAEVNHVGIITATKPEVIFIHASTTKGVMENKLSEPYYQKAFVNVIRVIND